jgi:tetratricopeptide (TPR) repeat protein
VTVTSSTPVSDDALHAHADSGRPGGLSKSPDQVAEERMLALQSTLRSHHRSASYSSALQVAQELLSLSLSHFGQLHPATASAYNNVGLMHKCLGNYVHAKEAYEQALHVYGQVCGKDHGSYAAALSNLGMLERGRVLEQLDDDDDDVDEDKDRLHSETESSHMEAQIHQGESQEYNTNVPEKDPQKTKLSSLERLQLNELAIEYFDEAYRIRLAELGATHPHTITSRSQLGSAMAYSVIMERRNRLSSAAGKGGLIEKELRTMKHQYAVRNETDMETYIPLAVARAASKSMETSGNLSKRRWEAAEEHLRGALKTAVEDPRGESVSPLEYLPTFDGSDIGVGTTSTDRGLFVKDRSLPKKDRKMAAKDAKREKRLANANASKMGDDASTQKHGYNKKIAIQGTAKKVTTLSAATAAQNLAVFLKNYSDWLRLLLLDDPSK